MYMQNILILANGEMAKHFVQWVGKSRIDANHYYITCNLHNDSLLKSTSNLTFVSEDPTSFLKLKKLMLRVQFSVVFIVMKARDEAVYSYKNIRMLDEKIRVVFVSQWDGLELDDENLSLININEMMAANLYEHLPNVPVIAKNIGLGKGEIMEVLVPFGSSYAYRHIGSISHRKWRIAAIYRNEKQILPNNATMIKPNDILVILGNPSILEELYKRITRRKGLFPEPFGRNLYLILDTSEEREEILVQVNEAIYLSTQFSTSKLYISLININFSPLIRELQALENDKIKVLIIYNHHEYIRKIEYDTSEYDIGLFLVHPKLFNQKKFQKALYSLRRSVYLFGEISLYNITQSILLMSEEREMESLSSSVFDLSERLGLKFTLCNYSPDGEFKEKKDIVDYYETLSALYNFKINIKEKRVNPIVELKTQEAVLHITPFKKSIFDRPFIDFFSSDTARYFLSIKKHPQLLIPIEE